MNQVDLAAYDNSWYHPGGTALSRALWFFFGSPLLRCRWITSSALRIGLLRLFGASVGQGVVMRHSLKVKYPWHLIVGHHCWFGEECWIDNLTTVHLADSVCVSQGAYLCTGNHDWTDPAFGLLIAPIHLESGSWAGARCILTPGTTLSRQSVAAAGSVVSGTVPAGEIYAGNPAIFLKRRVIRANAQSGVHAAEPSAVEVVSRT